MSPLPPKADITESNRHVRLVPKADILCRSKARRYSITSSAISSVVVMSRPQQSRMWTPRRGRQQLDLLCHDKRPELRDKAFHEVLVGEDPCPVLPPVGVVIKLPSTTASFGVIRRCRRRSALTRRSEISVARNTACSIQPRRTRSTRKACGGGTAREF